jgi:hypothetical protein
VHFGHNFPSVLSASPSDISCSRVLLTLDRQLSSFSGRQCVLRDEEWVLCHLVHVPNLNKGISSSYDVDLPIDCDDEFWDHPDPALNFKQPLGKPSSMSFFICYLRLHDILATAMRALVSRCIVQ